jgi:two-component system OmpR family response regulator
LSELGTALLVGNDSDLAGALRRHLARAGFIVHCAATGADAIRRASESAPDVVLLDASPEGGPDACRRIREAASIGDVPVLALTDSADLGTKLLLFAAGADDVVVKPCSPMELLARSRALTRRSGGERTTRRVGPLRVGLATGDAWIGEHALDLTAGERSMLVQLVRAYPGVTTRASLDRVPWRTSAAGSNVTEVLVARLRRKIGAAGGGVEIRSVRRSGYVLRQASA